MHDVSDLVIELSVDEVKGQEESCRLEKRVLQQEKTIASVLLQEMKNEEGRRRKKQTSADSVVVAV